MCLHLNLDVPAGSLVPVLPAVAGCFDAWHDDLVPASDCPAEPGPVRGLILLHFAAPTFWIRSVEEALPDALVESA